MQKFLHQNVLEHHLKTVKSQPGDDRTKKRLIMNSPPPLTLTCFASRGTREQRNHRYQHLYPTEFGVDDPSLYKD